MRIVHYFFFIRKIIYQIHLTLTIFTTYIRSATRKNVTTTGKYKKTNKNSKKYTAYAIGIDIFRHRSHWDFECITRLKALHFYMHSARGHMLRRRQRHHLALMARSWSCRMLHRRRGIVSWDEFPDNCRDTFGSNDSKQNTGTRRPSGAVTIPGRYIVSVES